MLFRSLPEEAAKNLIDQFRVHPDRGYLHCRGQLDYVLTLRNHTQKMQALRIERTLLSDDPGAGPPPKPVVGELKLEPKGSSTIEGSLSSLDVPIGKPKLLAVRVTSADGTELASLRVPFRQLPLKEYIEIEPTRDLYDVHKDGSPENCFLVNIRRKSDDPNTDPVLFRNMHFSIDGQSVRHSFRPNDNLYRRRGVVLYYEITPSDTVLAWQLQIEDEDVAGHFEVKKPPAGK